MIKVAENWLLLSSFGNYEMNPSSSTFDLLGDQTADSPPGHSSLKLEGRKVSTIQTLQVK